MVKICGLREAEHAVAAVEAGADLLGFVFAPSRRRVTAERAAVCLGATRDRARALGRTVLGVGVFVDASDAEMNEVAEVAGLDVLQLHGDHDPGLLERLNRPVIKALRVMPGAGWADLEARMDAYATAASTPIAFFVDGYDPVAHGGTGVRADWGLAGTMAANGPLVLAGGLDPENVGDAIAAVRPLAVDVSSGVETDGSKDPAKIADFVEAAKAAFSKR